MLRIFSDSVTTYYSFVGISFLYLVFKYRNRPLFLLIVLCFYSGLASFLGKNVENPYKIALVFFSFIILIKTNSFSHIRNKEWLFILSVSIFVVSFILSAVLNETYFNLTFSQLGKIFTPVCFFFVFSYYFKVKPLKLVELKNLFFQLLIVQIVLSIIKIFTVGLMEYIVGSVAYIGGGPATILPVFGFILIWLDKKGTIKNKDWIFPFLLILIGFVSFKRAIWFILPIVIFMFIYYVPKKNRVVNYILIIPVIAFIFYLGVRLNPTLNKENQIWGSFDLRFAMDYATEYNFGKTKEAPSHEQGIGRGGTTLMLFEMIKENKSFSRNNFWGYGLQEIFTVDYESFNEQKYNVRSKGDVTGIFQTYIATGFIGVFSTMLLIITILNLINQPRIRFSIGLLLFWDYLFYGDYIIRTQALFILLFFIIVYSNYMCERGLFHKSYIIRKIDKDRDLSVRSA